MAVASDLLSPSQAARRAGVSESTLRNWHRSGRLPAVETALGRLFEASDVDRAVAERNAAEKERR